MLQKLKAEQPDGVPYVFLTDERYMHVMGKLLEGRGEEGRQLLNNALRDFKALARRSGVKECTVHDLRRSCLTNWARKVPAHVLQKLAGHSSMETTLKYYLSVDRGDLELARRVGDVAILSGIPTDPKVTQSAINRQNGEFSVSEAETEDWHKFFADEDLEVGEGWYARRDSNTGPAV